MRPIIAALCAFVASLFQSRWAMHLKILALQHQLAVYKQTVSRPKLQPSDRLLWAWLSRLWPGWQQALAFVQPRTVLMWQKKRFRDYWRGVSQQSQPGRPAVPEEVRALIRDMWRSNPTWGSPRIVGLRKLLAKSTVEKYRPRVRKPSSPTWKTFLNPHVHDLVACDFFLVPTATCRVLFVFIMLAHERRRIVHFNITEHPTAQWTTQQIVEAFPWDTVPRYLLRDRDSIYSEAFQHRIKYMGIEEVKTAPRSPWQILTASGSSGVSVAMCSIMSSSSTTGISGACSPHILPITTAFVPICPSIWIAPSPALSSHRRQGR